MLFVNASGMCETTVEREIVMPSNRSTLRIHWRMSVSASSFSLMTFEVPELSPCTCRSASTWRSVTGSIAGMSGSAKRSMMPNVPDENFASGGIGAVWVASGKKSAFASLRPLTSLRFDGASMVTLARSGNGAANSMALTSSALSSGAK